MSGSRTFLGPGAEVGVEGPATLQDAVLGARARVDAGYVEGAVLLDAARVGWGGHLRPGTLLEEEASTAHCVGLKHTILLSFVTLGSVINFCDVLMAGGSSRRDHSEVGSGFIHFNFTPWGERGDKATPTLVGDVTRGVFLRERRIFLGGAGGLVGPGRVGYGSVTAAGQVVRRTVGPERLVLEASPKLDRPFPAGKLDELQPRLRRNVEYIGQLVALRAWYRHVRLRRVPTGAAHAPRRTVLEAARDTLESCIAERVERLEAFVRERGGDVPAFALDAEVPACPLPLDDGAELDHVAWVKSLDDAQVSDGAAWLTAIAARATESMAPSG
ncbi:UDP-N-acetylglucosamine pyrophosphorylase [Paraliomyxa miuraensis]|uniref:UDP-N-acetylglucosamine pyrophosphorylase n=1 Tax=Paraliomyxa miuraensis TaxID=376150 RepID=UPI00224EE9D0|nr:UDP-N-acetylglucosamine pyrophosphorylase [Paraliomyxa miuraensis]